MSRYVKWGPLNTLDCADFINTSRFVFINTSRGRFWSKFHARALSVILRESIGGKLLFASRYKKPARY